ncbi:MAG: cyclic nucleotide-binding domain-containing protein [Lachnospiraceae bacterium]|nr:cyclic nucleotide-binding domain-containing protein [Lachnospiraceae bacterium]
MTSYTKNQTIIQAGDRFTSFHIITEGSVAALYDSSEATKSFTLKKGDVIGIFDFSFKEYSFTYKALESTNVITYSLTDFSHLEKLLEEHKELSHFLVLSMVHSASKVISYYQSLLSQQDKNYQYIVTAFSNYQKLCKILNMPMKSLANKDQLTPFSAGQEEPEFWLESYYQSLKAPILEHNPIFSNVPLVVGLLARSVDDIHKVLYCCEDISGYLRDLNQLLINETSLDLFDLYTDLLFRAKTANKDVSALEERIQKMISILSNHGFIDKALVTGRIQEYEHELKRDHSYDTALEESLPQVEQKLSHSLETILDYADTMDVTRNEFIKYIDLFKKLTDKNSLDKNADTIRRQLTRLFNIIYTEVFQIALKDPTPPTIVKMFLHFGYVDLELAGLNNAAYLYSIAKTYQGDPENGIYTLYEWITAIYNGKKQPSRNELSQDYASYVHTLRAQGKIDPKGVQKMLDDTTGKVMYELESMFPSVNKVTHGHFTTFCPIFLQENVVKDLSSILITPYKLKESLNRLLEIDFSAFYRSYLYADDKLGLRENVLIDIHPDFILMPNVGSNGICWQEVEGMQRSTPARMMVSAFHAENLDRTMINMVGDFRWEMCRRVQGMRWNDISEHSLTSEYYDYALFYAKNRDLSQDAKEKIKLAMGRAKGNYKSLFVMDYANWIMSESKGSVKLNKVARKILSTYIPFRAEICTNLMTNNTFTECIQQYDMKKKQQLHRLRKLIQKYLAQGKAVPEVIETQIHLIDL